MAWDDFSILTQFFSFLWVAQPSNGSYGGWLLEIWFTYPRKPQWVILARGQTLIDFKINSTLRHTYFLSSLELLGSLLLHQNVMQAAMTGLEVAQSTTSGHQVGWRWGWRNVHKGCSKMFFFLVPWFSGPVVPWSSGPVVLWSCGRLVAWSSGLVVL